MINRLGGERFDLFVQPRFISGSLIFVKYSLCNHFVDDWYSFQKSLGSFFHVIRFYRRIHTLDVCPSHRSLAGITNSAPFPLSRSFSSLCTVGQILLLARGINLRPANMPA